MPRSPRKYCSTDYYHVMLRGINREDFFKNDKVKGVFMELLKEQQDKGLISTLAWCVMSNHVHLLLKADLPQLSKAIKVITLKFAAKYNAFNGRSGPVFGDRFRSECIEDDAYLLGALRYIHQNPVKAGIVSEPSAYAWSSYTEYLSDVRYLHEEQRSFALGMIGGEQRFVKFHAVLEDAEYLEMREDVQAERRDRALRLVEDYCTAKGVDSARQLLSYRGVFVELCAHLTGAGKLTLRQTAEVLGVSHRKVFDALQSDAGQ